MSVTKKISGIAVIGWAVMGFYQLFPYTVACSLLSAYIGAYGFGRHVTLKEIMNQYAPIISGVILAIALWFLTYKFLGSMIQGREMTASRPFGIEYIHDNLVPYFQTIYYALNPFSGIYAFLLSKTVIMVLVFGLGSILWTYRFAPFKAGLIATAIGIVALMLPNPTNILLKTYWPSLRTLSPVAIFIAFILLAVASRWTKTIAGIGFGRLVLVVCAISQFFIYANIQKSRFDQQAWDFSMAHTIINRAYEEFGSGEAPTVKINFNWKDNLIYKNLAYDFGGSLFGASWGIQGLISYLSNHRVKAIMADPDDCTGTTKWLEMQRVGNVLLVCAKK
jgi:hypothetical protein